MKWSCLLCLVWRLWYLEMADLEEQYICLKQQSHLDHTAVLCCKIWTYSWMISTRVMSLCVWTWGVAVMGTQPLSELSHCLQQSLHWKSPSSLYYKKARQVCVKCEEHSDCFLTKMEVCTADLSYRDILYIIISTLMFWALFSLMWQKHSEKFCIGDLFLLHENTLVPSTLSVHEFLAAQFLSHAFCSKTEAEVGTGGEESEWHHCDSRTFVDYTWCI